MSESPEPGLAPSDDCTRLTFDSIVIDEAKILRLQGYRDPARIRPVIRRAATAAARETETLIRPLAYYRCLEVRRCVGDTLELDDGTTFRNEAFQRFLNQAKEAVVFVLTMGQDLDEAVKRSIADDQLLNALFLETAGWLGIEATTKRLMDQLRGPAQERGLRLSPRLGPGYSYKLDGRSVMWPLEQQQTLFGLFAGSAIDIELMESSVMLPKFSRSGLFGCLHAKDDGNEP